MTILSRIPRSDQTGYVIYLLAALAVMLPLLRPGFILTLDMVFTPVLRLPHDVTASYPFHGLLHVLNLTIPADVLQKILLLAILLLSSIGLHRLVRTLPTQPSEWGLYAASVFFAINPFTYSRFMAGQYAVLLGYALLPWFVRQLVLFARQPNAIRAAWLGGMTTAIGIVSIHTLAVVGILTAAGVTIAVWQRRIVAVYAKYAGIAVGMFVLLSSYWLVPLLAGQGKTAQTIQSFTAADAAAFATTGGSALGRLGNILRLQGFWAEGRMLYLLPQEHAVLWGLTALGIIGLSITGLVWLWRRSPGITGMLGIGSVAGIVLALGIASGPLTSAGLREPHKLVSLVALAYSVGLAYGIHVLLRKCAQHGTAVYTTAAVFAVMLPLLLTRVMFWGASGQLAPRSYPADWQAVNARLNADPGNFSVLFLPWHQYMAFGFSGRIIGNPAPAYFDKPVIASEDPEFGGATSGQRQAKHIDIEQTLKTAADSEDFGRQLAKHNIKYVLLAKEADYDRYAFMTQHAAFALAHQYPTITLYENKAWRNP